MGVVRDGIHDIGAGNSQQCVIRHFDVALDPTQEVQAACLQERAAGPTLFNEAPLSVALDVLEGASRTRRSSSREGQRYGLLERQRAAMISTPAASSTSRVTRCAVWPEWSTFRSRHPGA